MVRSRQWPSADFFAFLVTFIAVNFLAKMGLVQLLLSLGANPAALEQLTSENEVFLQVISMVAALFVVFRRTHRDSHRWAFLRTLYPRPMLPMDLQSALVGGRFLKGFLAASTIVATSLFLGFVSVEWPRWDFVSLGQIFPTMAGQFLLILAWVLLVDRSLLFLWKALVVRAPTPTRALQSRVLLMGAFAHQLYLLLGASPHAWDKVFTALVCALLSGAYLLWMESGTLFYGGENRAALVRVSALAGFSIGLVNVYGQVIGGYRVLSVVSLFKGPLSEPTGSLSNAGLIGASIFLLFVAILVNLLLTRILRRSQF